MIFSLEMERYAVLKDMAVESFDEHQESQLCSLSRSDQTMKSFQNALG